MACAVLAGGLYALYTYEPDILLVITWEMLAITAGAILLVGFIITMFCTWLSVNKFLRMKAGELYKI
jgi:cell division transport system permease protein